MALKVQVVLKARLVTRELPAGEGLQGKMALMVTLVYLVMMGPLECLGRREDLGKRDCRARLAWMALMDFLGSPGHEAFPERMVVQVCLVWMVRMGYLEESANLEKMETLESLAFLVIQEKLD